MVGILLSYWGGLFSGAMLVSERVHIYVTTTLAQLPSMLDRTVIVFKLMGSA